MRKLFLLVLFLATLHIFSQEKEDYIYETPYVQHFTYKQYGMHTQCWNSTQDSTGKLYIANNEGVAVYDGVNWEKIPLIWAWSIKNLNNTIYVGSNNISYLSTDSSTLKTKVNHIFIDTAKYQISNKLYQNCYETSKSLFFSNRDNLVEIKNKKFIKSYNISNSIVLVYNDNIFIQRKGEIRDLNQKKLLGLDSLKKYNVYDILTHKNRAYFVVEHKYIYSAYIDKTNKYKFSNLKKEYSLSIPKSNFASINQMLDNNIILALNSGGLLIFNTDTKKEFFINKSNDKNIGIINSISITNNKNLIANTDNGFYIINFSTPIKYLKHSQKLKSIITSFKYYKGFLYVTTLDGLYKLKKQGKSNKYSIVKLNKEYNSFLKLDVFKDKLYVSSRNGVALVENDKLEYATNDDIGFYFVFSKKHPFLYVGTSSSLKVYKKVENKYKNIYSLTDLQTNVNSIVEHNNNLWFYYSNTQVAKLSIDSGNFSSMKVFDIGKSTLSIDVVKNKLLVTSEENGVCHYFDYKDQKFKPFEKLIRNVDGKKSYYHSFTKLNENEYFALSNNNIITKVITSTDETKFIDMPYKNLGADQYFGMYFDSLQKKLFVGGAGFILTVDNVKNTATFKNNFKTFIRNAVFNDSIVNPEGILKRKAKAKFLFSSNNLYKSELTVYSYKLEGFDDKWSNWSKDAFAVYKNLSYGEYKFKVKSRNIYDQISDEAIYSFTIEPAFYQTITARILGTLLLIFIIYLIVYLNSKRLKSINSKLELQVSERTKEIQKQNIELEKLSIVAKETDNSVLIYDSNGNLEWINEGAERQFGYTLEDIWHKFGKNIKEISNNPEIEKTFDKIKEIKKSVHYNSKGQHKNGKLIWTRTTLSPITDDDNNLIKIIAIDSDITEVKLAEEKIQNQNTLINHSIEYAKRIQTAVLPSITEITNNTKDAFILFKPRDIVSGDFYWLYSLGEKTIIISADCTGHGVPGGFMSMIGNTILNNIIKEKDIFDPDIILDYLNNKINSIVNKDAETGQSDGMDISIALIDREDDILELAAANQTIFIVKNEKIEEFYGDIWSIGGAFNEKGQNNFTSKKYKLSEVSNIYFSTDGYYDQFGGENDKKLMKDVFVDLIRKSYKLPMQNQKEVFENFLNDWKNNCNQTDDIQVVGVLL